jgi:hypothetical protein
MVGDAMAMHHPPCNGLPPIAWWVATHYCNAIKTTTLLMFLMSAPERGEAGTNAIDARVRCQGMSCNMSVTNSIYAMCMYVCMYRHKPGAPIYRIRIGCMHSHGVVHNYVLVMSECVVPSTCT